jgi:signal transduction histidine kinase
MASASLGNVGQAAVRQRAQFGSLIADLSASFVGLPVNCIDAAIEGGLRQTVEALGVDHGAFYQSTGNGLTVTHSWPAENFETNSDSKQADNLTWLADELRRKGLLLISKTQVASGETAKEEFLFRLGLESVVLVGVMTGGSLLGALMLGSSQAEAAWGVDPEPPQILGAVFAEALARKQNEERLLESDDLSHTMLDSLECHIVVINQDGRVIAASAGRHCDAESGAPFLNGVSLGINYFDTCRLAFENGLESAAILLEGIDAVVKGSREMFEMEYEYLSPSGQKFFLVSVTPRSEAGSGAVISHIETTERRLAQTNLRELSGKMITSLEEERRRIARELHDDVSQRLALMGIEMEQIIQALPRNQLNDVRRRLQGLWGQNQETSLEVRRLSHNLHSSKLEYLGLVAAVKSLCNELSNHQELRIRFKHFDVPSSIPKDAALCIYRVVQESLRNVIKHSGAPEAQVVLSGGHREIHLCVSDEGAGFDPDSNKAKTGIGLIGIRERLLLVGGEVSIESQPLRGARIVARVPLPEQGKDTNVLKRL